MRTEPVRIDFARGRWALVIICFVAGSLFAQSTRLSHSTSPSTVTSLNSISCNTAGVHDDNGYMRTYNLASFGITTPVEVTSVRFGVEIAQSGPGFTSQPLQIRLYTDPGGGAPAPLAGLSLQHTEFFVLTDRTQTTFSRAISQPVALMPTDTLVVELWTPNAAAQGHSSFIGSNALGETSPSYLRAAACAITEPATLASIGFPQMQIILDVDVTPTGGCPTTCGDCNLDGVGPNVLDALVAAQISAGILVPQMGQLECCDVNSTMQIEILDALLIAQSAAGLGVMLNCPGGGPPPPPPSCTNVFCGGIAAGVTGPGVQQYPPPMFDLGAGGAAKAFLVDVTGRGPGDDVRIVVSGITDDCDLWIANTGVTCGTTSSASYRASDSNGQPGTVDEWEDLTAAEASAYGNRIPIVVHHWDTAPSASFDVEVTCQPTVAGTRVTCNQEIVGAALAAGAGTLSVAGSTAFYYVDTGDAAVAAADYLVFITGGTSGDVDLYIGDPGVAVGSTSLAGYTSRSEQPANHESWIMNSAGVAAYGGGLIPIAVHGFAASTSWNLIVLCTSTSPSSPYFYRQYVHTIGDQLSTSTWTTTLGRDRMNVMLETWRDLYELRMNVHPAFKFVPWTTGGAIDPTPYVFLDWDFDESTLNAYAQSVSTFDGVHTFLADQLTSCGGGGFVYGCSPRPVGTCFGARTRFSNAVSAGPDMSQLSLSEAQFLARICAHESGHALNLPHTSNLGAGGLINGYDSYPDTPTGCAIGSPPDPFCPDANYTLYPVGYMGSIQDQISPLQGQDVRSHGCVLR